VGPGGRGERPSRLSDLPALVQGHREHEAGAEVVSFFASDPSFVGEVSVGNRSGDDPRLQAGAGPGGAPRVIEYTPAHDVTASHLAFAPGPPAAYSSAETWRDRSPDAHRGPGG